MRHYEIIYIIHPDLDDASQKEVNDRVTGWITEAGGTITKATSWGKKQLAYPIRKKNEGSYMYLEAELEPGICLTLERNFNLLEPVMRFLITNVD